jgi:hypothetical protein
VKVHLRKYFLAPASDNVPIFVVTFLESIEQAVGDGWQSTSHYLHQPSVLLSGILTENMSPDNIALHALVLVSRLDGLERCILGSSLVFAMGTLL